nr:cytochrome P450 [Pharsalia antennata]
MFLLIVLVLLPLLYIIITKYKYWENRGVPGPKPLPIIGNVGVSLIGRKNLSEIYAAIYHKYEDCPFVGFYRMFQPCLIIRDPEIIKNVLIKDFSHFRDNEIKVHEDLDPLLSQHTFVMKGERWKKARQTMTPNFASGKMKAIFPLAENVSKNLVKYLEKQGDAAIDAKDAFTKYSCDLVAVCALGIEGHSFDDPNAEFLTLARKFATPGISLQAIKLTLAFFMPTLIKAKLLPQSFEDGMMALTNNTLQYRTENNIERNDFFGNIARTPSISPIEIAAHMANFLIDGFESSSTVLTFVLYELAVNPECQTKLRNEILSVLKKCEENFTYEAMQDMVYLDACVRETLRVHPGLAQLSKICTEPYTMTSSGSDFRNISVTVEKGTTIIIPLLGLHRDAKYFSTPDKFIPERFLDKTEDNMSMYMPFGSGQRMCIGSRFGLLQVKLGIAQMIRNFEITLNEKTIYPLEYDPIYFTLYPKGGFWFNCKKVKVTE